MIENIELFIKRQVDLVISLKE